MPEEREQPHPKSKRRRRPLLVALGLAAAFGLGIWAGRGGELPRLPWQSAEAAEAAHAAGTAERPFRGSADAPVTVVEFTDYQCPFCKRYFDATYRPLLSHYGDRIRYEVRNFPIRTSHPDAQKAAEAAECAAVQGEFWAYHDILFERQAALDVPSLKAYAAELDLDTGRFEECLDTGRMAPLVDRDLREGYRIGISGTPGFLIDGRLLLGAQPLSVFRQWIDGALAEGSAREEAAGGAP